MKGQKVGYIRVSSVDQNPCRQLEGLTLDRIFIEKFTGKVLDRPRLIEMMAYVRDGDHVFVHSMDRLARNLMDLRKIVNTLNEKKVTVQFMKENLTFTGEDSPMSMLLLSMMGAFAEFEVQLIRERQREGIRLARQKGVYPGRKKYLSKEQTEQLKEMITQGMTKDHVSKYFKISRKTVYNYLNKD